MIKNLVTAYTWCGMIWIVFNCVSLYSDHRNYASWFFLSFWTLFTLYFDGQRRHLKKPGVVKKPNCFGTIEVSRPQCRAENGCEDCPHETDCRAAYEPEKPRVSPVCYGALGDRLHAGFDEGECCDGCDYFTDCMRDSSL